MSAPSRLHEYRRTVLDTVAILAGFETPIPLPDGSRPDVARVAVARGAIFFGDAKYSEDADDSAVMARLRRYSLWMPTRGWPGIFAVCHRPGCAESWGRTLRCTVADAIGDWPTARSRRLAVDAEISWVVCGEWDGQMSLRTQLPQSGRRARHTRRPWTKALTWKL